MRHFNFETNIEERLPWNGKVYFVNRMTSDYAERYPLNVDEFVNGIASKYGADAQRVRQFFYYGLGKPGESRSTHCPAKFKDKIKKDGTIIFGKYPDYMNGSEPAMVEAWHKGVEYHTKGLRQGDTLPQIVPPCKITKKSCHPDKHKEILSSRQKQQSSSLCCFLFHMPVSGCILLPSGILLNRQPSAAPRWT